MDLLRDFLKHKYALFFILTWMFVRILEILLAFFKPIWMPNSDYILPHYLISYSLAFMPRALIGTLYEFALKYISSGTFFAIFLVLQIILYLGIGVFAYNSAKKTSFSQGSNLLLILFFSCPLFWLTFYDLGRFDVFLLTITFTSLYLIIFHKIWACMLIPILIPAGVLIHEIFLFYIPVLLIWSLYGVKTKKVFSWFLPLLLGISSAASLFLLWFARNNMPAGKNILEFIKKRNHFTIKNLTFEAYVGSGEKVKSYFDHFCGMYGGYEAFVKVFVYLIFFFATCSFALYWMEKLIKHCNNKTDRYLLRACLAAGFFPLLISTVACDYGRWLAGSFWCFFLSCFCMLRLFPEEAEKIEIPKKWVCAVAILSLFGIVQHANGGGFSIFSMMLSNKINQILQLFF